MKKLFFAAIAIVAFAGCVKNEVNEVTVNDEIGYQAVVGKATSKAPITGTEYDSSNSFISYATVTDNSVTSLYINNSTITNVSGTWKNASTTYYWPKAGSMMFYACHPASTANVTFNTTDGLKITGYEITDTYDTDLMVAKPYKVDNVVSHPTDGVPTNFQHILTWINSVKFEVADGLKTAGHKFTVKSVKFKNVLPQGTYSLAVDSDNAVEDGSWSATGTAKDYTWYSNDTGVEITEETPAELVENKFLYAIPQDFATSTEHMEIVYTHTFNSIVSSDITATYTTSSALTWGMNKKINYTITLGLDEIIWKPAIEVWDAAAVGVTGSIN